MPQSLPRALPLVLAAAILGISVSGLVVGTVDWQRASPAASRASE